MAQVEKWIRRRKRKRRREADWSHHSQEQQYAQASAELSEWANDVNNRTVTYLTPEQWDRFQAALDAPDKVNPKLQLLFARRSPWEEPPVKTLSVKEVLSNLVFEKETLPEGEHWTCDWVDGTIAGDGETPTEAFSSFMMHLSANIGYIKENKHALYRDVTYE